MLLALPLRCTGCLEIYGNADNDPDIQKFKGLRVVIGQLNAKGNQVFIDCENEREGLSETAGEAIKASRREDAQLLGHPKSSTKQEVD